MIFSRKNATRSVPAETSHSRRRLPGKAWLPLTLLLSALIFVTGLLVIANLPPQKAYANAATSDLFRNKACIESSFYSSQYKCGEALKGIMQRGPAGYASTNGNSTDYLRVDAGQPVTLSLFYVLLDNTSCCTATGWTLAGSSDDVNWTTLYTGAGSDAGGKVYFLPSPVSYQYYRLQGTGWPAHWSVYGLQGWSNFSDMNDGDLFRWRECTSTTAYASQYPCTEALRGYTQVGGPGYASAPYSVPVSITVDTTQSTDIRSFSLLAASDPCCTPVTWTFSGSDDESTWTPLYVGSNTDNRRYTLPETASFRYYKIQGTGFFSFIDHWSIWSLSAYADPAPDYKINPDGDALANRPVTTNACLTSTCSSAIAAGNDISDTTYLSTQGGNLSYTVDTGNSLAINWFRVKFSDVNFCGSPTQWRIAASNDGTTYTTIFTSSIQTWWAGTYDARSNNTTAYRYYKYETVSLVNNACGAQLYTFEALANAPCAAELRGGGSMFELKTICDVCEPINVATGNFWHTFTDLTLPGRGLPLQISRTYNSEDASRLSPLGYGWSHSYNMWIDRDGSNNYLVHLGNGSIVTFDSAMNPPQRLMATLTSSSGIYVFTPTKSGERYLFQSMGTPATIRLYQIADQNGNVTALTYLTGGNYLSTVTDPASRTLTFAYTTTLTNTLVSSITDSAGREVSFDYDEPSATLTGATDITGQTSHFTYDSGHRLLTMSDALGNTVTNVYDLASRVTAQTDPLDQTTYFGYLSNSTVVTDTAGLVTTYNHEYNMLTAQNTGTSGSAGQWSYTYKPGTTWVESQTDPYGNTSHFTWDGQGNKLSATDPLTHTTYYTYTSVLLTDTTHISLLSAEEDAFGHVTQYAYNNRGLTTVITNTQAQTVSMAYSTSGQLIKSTDTGGISTCQEYDSSGNLTARVSNCVAGQTSTAIRNVRTEYGYDSAGRSTWTKNATGEITRTFYRSDNRLDKIVTGCAISGAPSTTTCDAYSSASPHLNRTTTYTYDTYGHNQSVTDPLGIVTRTEYDSQGRISQTIANYNASVPANASTNVTSTVEYDTLGRAYKSIDPLGRETVSGFDNQGRAITQTVNYVDGNPLTGTADTDLVTLTEYDKMDRPITTTVNYVDGAWDSAHPDQDLKTVTFYDTMGREWKSIRNYVNGVSSSGETDTDLITLKNYDVLGNLVAIVDPLGRASVSVYNSINRQVEQIRNCTNGSGVTLTAGCATGHGTNGDENVRTATEYNDRGQGYIHTDALGRETHSTYDDMGRVTDTVANYGGSISPTSVSRLKSEYDALGHSIVITNAVNSTQSTEYNSAGWVTRITDPTNRTTQFLYDGLGRKYADIDPLGHQTRYVYDGLGRLTKTVANWQDANVDSADGADQDLTTEVIYDRAGRRLALIAPDGKRTNYTYDGLDRLTNVVENADSSTAPADVTTTYTYDRRGLLTGITDAQGHHKYRGYSALGIMTSETDALSRITTYAYDKGGRLSTIIDSRPMTVTRTYDGLDRLTNIAAPGLTTISMQYDLQGRRTSLTDETGTTDFVYDGLDRLTQTSHSVDGDVNYAYDLAGRRTNIGTSNGAPPIVYSYDEAGRMTEVSDSSISGWGADASYDTAGRLSEITRSNGITTNYAYDGANRPVVMTGTLGSTVQSKFAYSMDRGSRAISASETVSSTTRTVDYAYDGLNRLHSAEENPGNIFSWDYDLVGNILTTTVGSTVTSRTYNAADQVSNSGWNYDGAGDLLTDGTNTYTYDPLKRMSSIVHSAVTSTYSYNGDNILTIEATGGVTTRHTLDLTGGLPERLGTKVGTTQTWFVRGYGQELAREAGGSSTTWYLADRIGSIRTESTSSGSLISTYNYEPYGAPEGAGPMDYGFSGEPQYSTTTLVQLRARWYNPQQGQFISDDPFAGTITSPQSLQSYLYSMDDPINWTDPTGFSSTCFPQPLNYDSTFLFVSGCISGSSTSACSGAPHPMGEFEDRIMDYYNDSLYTTGITSNSAQNWGEWKPQHFAYVNVTLPKRGAPYVRQALKSIQGNGNIHMWGHSAGAGAIWQYLAQARNDQEGFQLFPSKTVDERIASVAMIDGAESVHILMAYGLVDYGWLMHKQDIMPWLIKNTRVRAGDVLQIRAQGSWLNDPWLPLNSEPLGGGVDSREAAYENATMPGNKSSMHGYSYNSLYGTGFEDFFYRAWR